MSTRTTDVRQRILLIDDEPANIRVLRNMLSPDHEILFATNGEKGLALADTERPDLILLDVVMPGMDGHQVLRRLKQNERTRAIPVIFVTAMDDPEAEREGLNLGAVDYITKPLSPPIVAVRVRNQLELKRQRDLLNEVNAMKSEFLSTAAHELRTPLANIYGYAEMLLEADFDEAARRDFVETIYKQAELVTALINELLDLSRIEARRGKDFVIEELDLGTLVREIVADYKPPEHRQDPLLRLGERQCRIRGDRKKLTQCLNNILSNAYKYSPAGGAVTVDLLDRDGRYGVTVRDQGIGMSPAQCRRVFERFYRADTSGRIPGTGLGMSIVKEIVDLHGGEVEIQSGEGEGTRVALWFPGGAA